MTDRPLKRHPRVAAVFLVGVGLLLLSWGVYRLASELSTLPFLLGLFSFGIVLVSGVWYITLVLRDLFWPSE